MTDDKPPTQLTPALGGKQRRKQHSKRTGLEPSLGSNGPERRVTIGGLLEQLHSPIPHRRFNAVLALASFPDSPSGISGIIRSLHDESLLVRLSALFALYDIGPRLVNPLLRDRAIESLEKILNDPKARISTLAANTLIAFSQMSDSSTPKPVHPAMEQLAEMVRGAQGVSVPFSPFALQTLERIGTDEAHDAVNRWLARRGKKDLRK